MNKKIILPCLFALIFLILALRYLSLESVEGYQFRGYQCITLLEEGTIYEGQPICVQGPVIYLVGWFLKLLFGLSHLQIASKILFSLISFFIFLFILKIIEKETSKPHPFIALLLFIPLVFYPSQADSILEIVLAAFLFLAGFYLLFYRQDKWKEIYAGLLFSLALLSKFSVIYLVLTFVIFYLIGIYRKEAEGRKFEICLEKSAYLLVPLLLPIIALFLLKPLSLTYLVLAPRVILQLNFSYLAAVKSFFSPSHIWEDLYHFFLMIIFSLNIYGLVRYKNKIFLAVIPGFVTFLEIIRMFKMPPDSLANNYALPVIVFLLAGVIILFDKEKKEWKRILTVSMLILLIIWLTYPIVTKFAPSTLWDSDVENEGFRKLVEYPLLKIPPQEGQVLLSAVLTDEEYLHSDHIRYINKSILNNSDRQRIITPFVDLSDYLLFYNRVVDLFGDESEIRALSEQAMHYKAVLNDDVTRMIEKKFLNLEYSLIIHTSPKSADINQLIENEVDFLMKNGYILTYVPNYIYPLASADHTTYLIFKNSGDVKALKTFLYEYYSLNFEKICARSESAANQIVEFMRRFNYINLDRECDSGKEEPSNIQHLNNLQRLLALLVLFALFLMKRK